MASWRETSEKMQIVACSLVVALAMLFALMEFVSFIMWIGGAQ